ncbi:MAG: tRNA (N(6)-L-threonylcarbamoyladenosine(37)-C(2))-methylthiotransferase MtaB [Tissierellaceae bacterium]|nr:tRNA (N(6)-L-threonylcarbamoyladenosine(37)-C(2))-methylthiotransferase MtaB [Tissierellaceae bacterium]
MNKVAFHTLGCKVNQYETEAMEKMFEDNGYTIVNEEEVADVYVINTCTVTNLSDRKSRQFIRRVKKVNADSVVAVVGCYSQVAADEVENIEGVDVIIGTSDRNRVVELCEKAKAQNQKINIVRSIKTYDEFEEINVDDIKSMTRAYIKIQDGCNQFCSYCIIPYARGPIRSRQIYDIIEETEKLANSGFKEVILTGIHIASYGKDLGDIRLGDVIREIAKVDGIERIRLSSVEPNLITEEFMEILVNSNKVCDHFHLSLQSGSDSILKRMNRKYTTDEFRENVDIIRKYMPNAGITTDIIVGFPGETEEEFEETLKFVKNIGFSRIHVFKYSPRKGTPAAKFEDQIHGSIKSDRSERLIKLGEELMNEFSSKYIGNPVEVLFEEEKDGYYEGYTTNYIRVKTYSDKDVVGKLVNVDITNFENEHLVGKIGR